MENIKEIFASFGSWPLVEDFSDDGTGIGDDLQLTKEGEEARRMIERELDKAREEGYQDCIDDIWEEARALRGWTEHDGSISATDIEAGLQEAYLNIESKLKDNK